MIYVYRKFDKAVDDLSARVGRRVTLEEIAEKAQVPLHVVKQMHTNACFGITLNTIDRLLRYFQLSHISDLVEYEADVVTEQTS